MLCDHPRRVITWTEYATKVILTEGQAATHRNTVRGAGQVAVVCLECGHATAFDSPADVPTWIERVLRETRPDA